MATSMRMLMVPTATKAASWLLHTASGSARFQLAEMGSQRRMAGGRS